MLLVSGPCGCEVGVAEDFLLLRHDTTSLDNGLSSDVVSYP